MQFLKASRWGQQRLRFAEWALKKAAIDKSRWLYGTLFLNKHKINKRALNEKKTLIAAVFNSVAAVEEYKSKKNVKLHKALVFDAAQICTNELTSQNSDQAWTRLVLERS